MDTLEEKKSQRFQFIHLLYKRANGSTSKGDDILSLGKELGLTIEQRHLVVDYLLDEGLIEVLGGGSIRLRYKGIIEVENALANREQPTRYFPPVVNIVTFHAPVSNTALQQGTHGSTQTISFTPETIGAMQEFLQQLKNTLPQLNLSEPDRRQTEAEVTTIEAQLAAPRPNVSIIKAAGNVLHGILVGVAGNLATDLLKHLAGFGS